MRDRTPRKPRKSGTTGCFCMFGKKKRAQQTEAEVEMEETKRWDHPDNLYASEAEQKFCEKFLVCGKIESYQSWHHFSQRLPAYLEEGSFAKMLIEIRQLFGLPAEKSSILSNYHLDYGIEHEHKKEVEPAGKHEAEIWHADNIIKLLGEVASHPENYGANVDALREFAKHFHAVLHAIDEFHQFHGFMARYDTTGALEIAETRLVKLIDSLDQEFQQDMAIARRRNSNPMG